MVTPRQDEFDAAAATLERLAQLRSGQLLTEAEHAELRGAALAALRRAIGTAADGATAPQVDGAATPEAPKLAPSAAPAVAVMGAVPYGQLHAEIVRRVADSYIGGGGTALARAYRAIAELAGARALAPEDDAVLREIADVVFAETPTPPAHDPPLDARDTAWLLDRLRVLSDAAARTHASPTASPAARAIADTARESTTRAAERLPAAASANEPHTRASFWRKYVLQDVDGAFQGGSAAVTIAPAFAPALGVAQPVAVAVAAAFGVVVGAGIRSGIAYGEKG
jgi:hypothetical protein